MSRSRSNVEDRYLRVRVKFEHIATWEWVLRNQSYIEQMIYFILIYKKEVTNNLLI